MGTRRAVLLVASIGALVVAAVLTLTPISAHGVDCGTPLAPRAIEPTDGENGEYVTSSSCTSAANDRKSTAVVLAIIGAVVLVGVLADARWTTQPVGRTVPPPDA